MSDGSADGVDRDLSEVRSKISEAKHELKSAARHAENAEQASIYRKHARELGVAIDTLREVDDVGE